MTMKAIIFDVDGTLAETEEYHRRAFNQAFADHGLDWHWDVPTYRALLKVAGGKERIRHYLESRPAEPYFDLPPDPLKDRIAALHQHKTSLYTAMVDAGDLPLRPGIKRWLGQARASGIRLAIATTTSRQNVESLIRANLGEDALSWFEIWATAEVEGPKKPDPAIYSYTLLRLNLEPHECLAIEDSENGLLASKALGIPTLITLSDYTNCGNFDAANGVISHLGEPDQPTQVIAGDIDCSGCVNLPHFHHWFI